MNTRSPRFPFVCLQAALVLLLGAGPIAAHEVTVPLDGKKLVVRTDNGPEKSQFSFQVSNGEVLRVSHDPSVDPIELMIRGVTPDGETRSELILLDPAKWSALTGTKKGADETGYMYSDATGSSGGITNAVLKDGELRVKGGTENWTWRPDGPQDAVWLHFRLEDEWYCARFSEAAGANVRRNQADYFMATNAPAPGACPSQICGNGVLEFGEDCDDGNLDETDGCNNDCSVGECVADSFDSTYEAVQSVIFDSPIYGCSNDICHSGDNPAGELDLRTEASYAALLGEDLQGADSDRSQLPRVKPAEPDLSFLYLKMAAATEMTPVQGGDGAPMPFIGSPLSEKHLEGVREWIRGGAPEEGVVAGTAQLFGTCLPDATPLTIPPVSPPALGAGVQLRQPPRPLPQESESEVCKASYYDFSQTELIPDWVEIDCPDRYQFKKFCSDDDDQQCTEHTDCDSGMCEVVKNATNPESRCFTFHKRSLKQDPQSHHSIIFMYSGAFGTEDEGWGEWRYNMTDPEDPKHGQPCDPKAVDPALGYNPGCSTEQTDAVACLFWGAPDYSNFNAVFGGGGNAPQVLASQEPFWENEFADGVYDALPMKGIIVWNSHAFNLTSGDSTLSQYLNLDFGAPEDQSSPVVDIFEAQSIFVQEVPPFETRQYCRTWTAPKDSNLYYLTSHTHQWGTQFAMWGPPNTPCVPECADNDAGQLVCFSDFPPDSNKPICEGPRDLADAIYFNTEYADPQQLYFDPPIVHDEAKAKNRTYLYCATYDNGSTPESPPVRRRTQSETPPVELFGVLGGPCLKTEMSCVNEPNQGMACGAGGGNLAAKHARCDSSPGAGDGICDACPVRGGVTTTDEMFILLGGFFFPESPE